ncbi:MAG: SulP family inorganic anion transporter [Desulfofustis sp.]
MLSPNKEKIWPRLFPLLIWWPIVSRRTFKADLLAGLIGAVVALPQGVAFATIAGMPPQYGLYTGMLPAVIAALFGSSWLLVSGPTTAASLVLFSSLSQHAVPGSTEYVQLAITVTFMTGMIQFSMGLVRFGSLVNFISHSVVVGFTAGAAILIIASQLKHFLGLDYDPVQGHFQDVFHSLYLHLSEINPYTVAVGCLTMVAGIAVRWLRPSLPYMIIAMIVGSLGAALLSAAVGKETARIAIVGSMPATLPPLSLPDVTLTNIRILVPTALAMALFALTEAISIARSLADKTDQEFDGNQEFIGQGLSNIVGSFFSCYVATGSFNRSGMNYEAGAKTPLAAVFAGLILIPVVLFLAPLAGYLPKSTLAAILFLVAWRLIDPKHIFKILKTSPTESVIVASTFLATLLLELQFAILLGILISLAIYLNRTSHPHIRSRVPDPRVPTRSLTTSSELQECPQLKIVRIDGSLYFGAVNHVRSSIRSLLEEKPDQKNLLIIGSGINFIDMAGAEFLTHLAQERREKQGALYFYDMKEDICSHFKFLEYLLDIGVENVFTSKREAIAEIFNRLDPEICKHCTARIFLECASIAPEGHQPVDSH